MADYMRSTRICGFDELKPEILAEFARIVEIYSLGDISPEALLCCETTSEKVKKGLFSKGSGGKVQYTDVVVTPSRLWWGVLDSGKVHANWAKLASIEELEDYKDTYSNKTIEDSGISFFGFVADAPERAWGFIGADGPDAEELKRVLFDAWRNARGESSGEARRNDE